jgi:hypothetical protein
MTTQRFILTMLAAVIGTYLTVVLVAVGGCLYFQVRCDNVDFQYFLGEPLAALLGLLAGRASNSESE